MDELLEKVRDVAEGQIDFEGQRVAEYLSTALLAIVGAVAFIVGYILQDIKLALYIGLAGSVLTLVAVVPPWPFLNRHPVQWLPKAGSEAAVSQGIIVDGKLVG